MAGPERARGAGGRVKGALLFFMSFFFFFFSSSGGWEKIKLKLTTLPRIFIRVVFFLSSHLLSWHFFFLLLPPYSRRNSETRLIRKQVLLPPPHQGTRLRFYREKISALSSLLRRLASNCAYPSYKALSAVGVSTKSNSLRRDLNPCLQP